MDTLPSAEFRKTYARLHRETYVTVNGHIIGKWQPMAPPEHVRVIDGKAFVERPDEYVDERFASRPFTPVPKPSQRRRGLERLT